MFKLHYNGGDLEVVAITSENILKTIEYASRVCYNATDRMNTARYKTLNYIGARVRSGHESVTEHGEFVVIFKRSGCSNVMFHEICQLLEMSNSLLHVFANTSICTLDSRSVIVSISGNLKMWRDFVKYLLSINSTTKFYEHSVMVELILRIFYLFSTVWCNGIFTDDLEGYDYLRGYSDTSYLNPTDTVYNVPEDPDDNPNEPSYDSNFKNIYDVNGIKVDMINVDDFVPRIRLWKNVVSNEIKAFVTAYYKEFSSITYKLTLPRIVSQQECRHRINSISQRSQRYVNEGDSKWYKPLQFKDNKFAFYDKQMSYDEIIEELLSVYNQMISNGVPKEVARNILPNAMMTEMVITKPMYTLPHYFKERCSNNAQMEIREPAIAIRDYLKTLGLNYIKQEDSDR